jgi:hypothetical protein
MSCARILRFSASSEGKPKSAKMFPSAGVTCDTTADSPTAGGSFRRREVRRGVAVGFLRRAGEVCVFIGVAQFGSTHGSVVSRGRYLAAGSSATSSRTRGVRRYARRTSSPRTRGAPFPCEPESRSFQVLPQLGRLRSTERPNDGTGVRNHYGTRSFGASAGSTAWPSIYRMGPWRPAPMPRMVAPETIDAGLP